MKIYLQKGHKICNEWDDKSSVKKQIKSLLQILRQGHQN